jgi:RNA polymerase sigma-70 factor (ECF subfamily)
VDFFLPDLLAKTVSLLVRHWKNLAMAKKGDGGPEQGFPESLSELLTKGSDRVQRFIEQKMRGEPRQSIEDVAQETYLRLLRLLPVNSVRNLQAYVLQVATNVVKDSAMKHSRERKRISFDSDAVDRLSEHLADGSVEDAQDLAEMQEELMQIMKKLPPILRATLLLCTRDELTYEEAAKKLGITPHAIKKYLSEARARFDLLANRR